MKIRSTALLFASILLALPQARAAAAPDTEGQAVVVERGPHSRTWQRASSLTLPDGTVRWRTNTWVELQSGLHRWDNGWVETDPRIEPFQDGAIVRHLQYQAIFRQNLNAPEAIDLQLPDGTRLTGQILGLAYTLGSRSVLIAEITNCTAEITGPAQNEIIWRSAFTDYAIDVRCTARRGSFSQDLIVRERLNPPSDYGLTDDAHLELLSELTTAPAPERETRVWEPARDGQRARISPSTLNPQPSTIPSATMRLHG